MLYYSLYTSACSIDPIPSPYLFIRCATKDTLAFGLFSVNQQQIQEEVVLENNQLICNTLLFHFEGLAFQHSLKDERIGIVISVGTSVGQRTFAIDSFFKSRCLNVLHMPQCITRTKSSSVSLGEESRQGKNLKMRDILVRQLDYQMLISLKDLISQNFLSSHFSHEEKLV